MKEEKRKPDGKDRMKGIFLIIGALILIGWYIMRTFANDVGEQNQESLSPIVTSSSVTAEITRQPELEIISPITTSTPISNSDSVVDGTEALTLNVRQEILNFIEITERQLLPLLIEKVNAIGYANATAIEDIGEMYVDYEKKTVTIPSRITTEDNKKHSVDIIYNYEKKSYRAVPY